MSDVRRIEQALVRSFRWAGADVRESDGVYFADTLNLTKRLTATVSGRFNAAFVDSTDFNGGDLGGLHSYLHFNPAAGLAYEFAPWLTVYGGYAMAGFGNYDNSMLQGAVNIPVSDTFALRVSAFGDARGGVRA